MWMNWSEWGVGEREGKVGTWRRQWEPSGLPCGSDGKESACGAGDLGLTPGLRRSPRRREQLPTPEFLPGEFHGQGSLEGYRGHKQLDTTERLSLFRWVRSLMKPNAKCVHFLNKRIHGS